MERMKSVLKLQYALILILLQGCAIVPQYAVHQQKYFPPGVDDVYLGMPFKFLSKTRNTTILEQDLSNSDSTRLVYLEKHTDKEFERIYYFIDNYQDKLLYEIAFEYPESTDTESKAQSIYGETNADGGEWEFDTPEGFNITTWTYGGLITVSARMLRQGPK